MATLKFIGFPDGAKVSVDALQDAQTESATVDAWGDPVVRPTVAIRVTRADVPEARHAPEGVKFEAFPSDFGFRDFGPQQDYDPEFHEIFYEWDFGDNRSPWTAPRLPDEFNAPSKGYGKRVGHVFVEPGEFMVTCTARQIVSLDPLQVLSAKTTTLVKVTDPEDIYGAQLTAVVALDGDFSGAPASNHRFTSTAAARTFVETRRTTPGMIFRVLLKRGEDYRWDLDAKAFLAEGWNERDAYDLAYVGAWGSGDKPLVPGLPATPPIGKCLIVEGLKHEGDWNIETEAFDHNNLHKIPDPAAPGGNRNESAGWWSVVDCEITKGRLAVYVVGRSDVLKPPFDGSDWHKNRIFFDNVSMTRNGDICMFLTDNPGDFLSLTGCALIDEYDNPPFRMWRNGDYYIDGSEFFSRDGWSGGGRWDDNFATEQPQPAVRFDRAQPGKVVNGNPGLIDPTLYRGSSYITRCLVESNGLHFSQSTIRDQQVAGNDVIERCLLLGGPQVNGGYIGLASGATTVRGNVMVTTDNTGGKAVKGFVGGAPDWGRAGNYGFDPNTVDLEWVARSPVQIYSNTCVHLYDPDEITTQSGFEIRNPKVVNESMGQEYDNLVNENNVLYAPLAPLAEDRLVHTPDLTTIGLLPRFLGRRLRTRDIFPTEPFENGEDGIVIQPRLCFKAARGLMEEPEPGDVPGLYIDQSAGAQKMPTGEWVREPFRPRTGFSENELQDPLIFQEYNPWANDEQLEPDETASGVITGLTPGETYKLRVNVLQTRAGVAYFGLGDLSVEANRTVTINGPNLYEGTFVADASGEVNVLAGPDGFDARTEIEIFETLDIHVTLPTGALDLAANASETQSTAVDVGKWYIFKLSISNHVSGALHLGTGDVSIEANRALDAIGADGTYEGIIQATSSNISCAATAAGFEGEITLEVFEVPGNHLTPSAGPAFALGGVPGTMPIVDDTGTLEWSPTGTSYTVCHVRADTSYTWARNVDAMTAADILQQPDTLGFFATEQDIAEPTGNQVRGDILYYLRQDHGVMQTQYATGDVLGWYEPTDLAEMPEVTTLPVALRSAKGTSIEDVEGAIPQGAHIEGTQIAAQSPISSSGAGVAQGPGDEDIHDFLADDVAKSFTLTRAATIHVQLVGGGGGGGNTRRGGGGGAGGVIYRTVTLAAGTYTLEVGEGGGSARRSGTLAENGGDTFIQFEGADVPDGQGGFLRAIGGGHGGDTTIPAANGGSGGGATEGTGADGVPGQGFKGGDKDNRGGAGGGGAGEAGGTSPFNNNGGDGGDGVASQVPGEATDYVGGGGGGWGGPDANGQGGLGGGGDGGETGGESGASGVPNTGGGAGGGDGDAIVRGGSGRATIWWVPE